ncbi:MAG: hypothetical protein JNM17_26405 [Archangium sp.]|nr:hypothetical protein [Archangium sp.]
MRCSSVLVFLVASGCMGSIRSADESAGAHEMKPAPVEVPAIVVVNGAPIDTTRPMRSNQGNWSAPSALWLQSGAATVLDGDSVKQSRATTNGNGFEVILVGTTDDARAPGSVRAMTVRGDGVFLAGTNGFFHDAPGRLLRSPLSDSFNMATIRFVDFTDGALWVTTSTEAVRVLDGQRATVKVNDAEESGALQAVVGRSASRALVVKGASLYAVDLVAREVKTLARGLTTVTAISHRDGVVLLGTDDGLVEVAADDVVSRRTLAAAGANAANIVDLEGSLVTTSSAVLHVTNASAVILSDVASPWPDSLAKDATGDVWFLDGASVTRLTTSIAPPPPSFAADVRPFFAAHCKSCHATGASYAPVLDLENYGVARTWAQATVRRLTDTLSPMPPASAEILTPAQYDVVVRWVDGGLLP